MFKGLKGIVISSIIFLILVTGSLTSFRFDYVVYVDAPYPPNPPLIVSIRGWLFCITLTIIFMILATLVVAVRRLFIKYRFQ
jgi:hypothetical protein